MSLANRCAGDFDSQVKARGRSYFLADRVELVAQFPYGVEALVEGSGRKAYEVTIDWDTAPGGELAAHCTCPYFSDGGLCKHVWATLLAVDRAELHRRVPGTRSLSVVSNESYDEDEDDDHGGFDEDGFGDDKFTFRSPRLPAGRTGNASRTSAAASRPPAWRSQLDALSTTAAGPASHSLNGVSEVLGEKRREAWYVLNVGSSLREGSLLIEFHQRESKRNGEFGKIKKLSLNRSDISQFTDATDRELLQLLIGNDARDSTVQNYYYGYTSSPYGSWLKFTHCVVAPAMYDIVLPRLCATGRFVWLLENAQPAEEGRPLAWDDGPAWRFRLRFTADDKKKIWRMTGELFREQQSVPLREPVLLQAGGSVVFADRMARLDAGSDFSWISLLRKTDAIEVPYGDRVQLLEYLWRLPNVPEAVMPDNLPWEQVRVEPRGHLSIFPPPKHGNQSQLPAKVSFLYDNQTVSAKNGSAGIVDRESQRILVRAPQQERQLISMLTAAGIQPAKRSYYGGPDADAQFPKRLLPNVVGKLVDAGWVVEAEGSLIRRPGQFKLSVTSSVDWFELDGQCDFDGVSASLPALLAALRKGERYVRLGDGSQGMLPDEWLAKYGALADLGDAEGDSLRFAPSQAMLLDALLAAQPDVDVDQQFDQFRQKLRSFDGVKPHEQPPQFTGELRHYQQEGLGWLHFLQEFRFGGCLADDMGLGKTVQVLALLESRRTRTLDEGQARAPSLVIVPRSLVFNWIEEAARFTPNLRVLNYTGIGRTESLGQLDQYDLLVTTYGTLRRDIATLKDTRFDYAILDESQAIKNSQSQAAKACRLINADHRLAMTGTPVENHLGELWSLFEYLNPGMLGRSSAFTTISKNGREDDNGSLPMLAQALRPFLLRRTKAQVLTELPDKTEQTLYCEMETKQRKQYDELRDFYRASLAQRVAESGMAKSKIHVLEALLRLRQAACHPGLLDKKKSAEPSAKMETLLEQITEVIAEGHKALVFSQFTSLLSIVRQRLDKQKIVYEYLDGRTRNRQEKVHRFQQDAACPLFLISLKAGGHGLNLTAADYVFILDPWWNPAVEAQAVDRAHRIGQTRRVFAYRLICRDTVEEKILELQKSKRDLADAIVSADNSLIRSLTAEDLQLLLS
jgi:superfamily II DNA or RNA helicase